MFKNQGVVCGTLNIYQVTKKPAFAGFCKMPERQGMRTLCEVPGFEFKDQTPSCAPHQVAFSAMVCSSIQKLLSTCR
jgi:hypothetical protein